MIYFVVSDIHSFAKELKQALKIAGFDKKNKNHALIVIGDCFDRGAQTLDVYKFLRSIPKSRCILIKGNHEYLYFDLLTKSFPESYDFSNGTVRTFCQIAGYDEKVLDGRYWRILAKADGKEYWEYEAKPYEYWEIIRKIVKDHKITAWLSSKQWKNYYETGNFIFTHSFLPLQLKDSYLKENAKLGIYAYGTDNLENYELNKNWRDSNDLQWEESTWGCPWAKYEAGLFAVEETEGKTLVVGHWHTSDFYKHLKNIENSGDIYFSKGIIGVDGGVFIDRIADELIHPQNVLIIKDNICYDKFNRVLTEPSEIPIIKTVTLKTK